MRCRSIALLGAAGAFGLAGLVSAPHAQAATGDPTTATLQGQWLLTATVTAYTNGGAPSPVYPVGHSGTVVVTFTERCSAPGSCTLTVAPAPGGTTFDQATDLALPDTASAFVNGVLAPLQSTYGYGGPGLPPCRAPVPQFSLTLQVTQAVSDATGDHAVTITGRQASVSGWTCNGAQAIGEYQIISIVGHPVGYVPPPSPTPVLRATAPAGRSTTAPSGNGSISHPLPSTITSAIAAPDQVFASPTSLVINAAVTIVVLLFITFPANLFNRTFDENYEEIMGMVDRRAPWLARMRQRAKTAAHEQRRHLVVFVVVLLLGAILGGFLDPRFGFNGSSLTTLVSVLLSISIGLLVGVSLGAGYRRLRGRGLAITPRALPAGLTIAVVCVVISRISDFHPGYLYGVICGIAFTVPISKREEAHLVALGAIASLALAVIAWFIWVPLHVVAARQGAGFGVVLADDVVGALFVGGLVGSVIGLFPLRFLPGGTLADWNRAVWAATFGLAVFGLLQLMLRPESAAAHNTKAALATAIVLFVLFGGASVLFRYYFYRRHRRAAAAASAPAG
jgi:hypothetical protein